MSGFFIIIGGFILRLTKLLLKVVLVLFCGKSSIYQFKRGLLSMREFSTHQSLKETPFVNVPILLSVVNDLCYPEERTGATDMEDKTKAGSGGSSDGMSRRAFLQSVGAASGALLAGISNDSSAASTKRPNILWIMTDEHRWDTICAYGRYDWVRSPNLDALAAEGVLFREAYCQAPLCVGSRVSMLTGRYPHHTGVYGFEYSHPDTTFSVPFFTELLHRSGYEVVNFGKEHHYRLASKDQPYTTNGRWYNVLNAFPDKDFHSWGKANIQEASPSQLIKGADREGELGVLRRYLSAKKLIIGGTNPVAADQTLTAHLSNMAIRHLETDASRDKPTCLRVSYIYPHTPVLPPTPFNRMYAPRSIPLPLVRDVELNSFGRQTKTAYENLRVYGMKEAEIRKMRADPSLADRVQSRPRMQARRARHAGEVHIL